MKTRLLCFASALALLVSAVPAAGDTWLADYRGYDYTRPLFENFTAPGQTYEAVGPIISMNEDFFVLDEDNFEYTVFLNSGTLTAVDSVGTYVFYHFVAGDGVLSFHEDAIVGGTQADFGTYPPNASCPSSFNDGTTMLQGVLTSLTIVIETEDGDGSLSGTFDLVGGDYLENIPPDMREGWTFSALGLGHPPFTPEGFMNQIDGEVYLTTSTPVERTSWGRLKQLHRR